jgi:hypothetical protein
MYIRRQQILISLSFVGANVLCFQLPQYVAYTFSVRGRYVFHTRRKDYNITQPNVLLFAIRDRTRNRIMKRMLTNRFRLLSFVFKAHKINCLRIRKLAISDKMFFI